MTSSSLASDFLIFSKISTPSTITSPAHILLIHSGFRSILSSLSPFTPFSRLLLLLNPSAFPILLPGMYLSTKSNLDKYRAHHACLRFRFWLLIKYSKFLWSIQISNFTLALSKKCRHASKHLITPSISLSCIS